MSFSKESTISEPSPLSLQLLSIKLPLPWANVNKGNDSRRSSIFSEVPLSTFISNESLNVRSKYPYALVSTKSGKSDDSGAEGFNASN